LDALGAKDATREILRLAQSSQTSQVVTLGTEMVVRAQRDATFREIINTSQLSVCDTVGLLAVARLRGMPIKERVTGVDLIENLCAAPNGSIPIYFLGGAEGIAEKAAATLRSQYSGVQIAGTQNGFFQESDAPRVCGDITASGAKILCVGLGSPRQELWLHRHLAATGCSVGIGVGGAFDVISGTLKRAPAMWQRFGFEWLYRLVTEPWRWRRQLALPYFVLLVMADTLVSLTRQKRNA